MFPFRDLLHDVGFYQALNGRVGGAVSDVQNFLGLGRGEEGIEEKALGQADGVGRRLDPRQASRRSCRRRAHATALY